VPGGKGGFFGWFQIVCLALFLAVIVGRTVRLIVWEKVNPITLTIRKRGMVGILELSLFVGVNIWSVAVLLYSLPLDVRPLPWPFGLQLIDSMAARIAGVLLIAVAFVVFILGLVSLGDSWRLGIDDRRPGELVTHGVYAVSRNPIYVFFDLYFIGTFLVNGALVFLVFAALTIVNLHYQILEEERFLSRIHGAAYESYCARTARYLGARWPRLF